MPGGPAAAAPRRGRRWPTGSPARSSVFRQSPSGQRGLLRQRAGERPLVERHAGDDGDVPLAAEREQLVLGGLVEDVVDDLHRVDQPGSQRLEDVGRLPAVDADADGADQALRASGRPPRAASARRPPRRLPRRGTAAGRSWSTPRFSRLFSVYSRMWSGGKHVVERRSRAARATCRFLGGILVATYSVLSGWLFTSSPEQLLAVALAVGPGRVEEVAAELDGPLERAQRLVVVRAGPARQAPHAVADLADRPARPPKGAVVHRSFPLMVSGCVECSLPGKVGG